MKKLTSIAISLFTLFSCATTKRFEEKMGLWIGKSKEDLITEWGVPDRTVDISDAKYAYEYDINQGAYAMTSRLSSTIVSQLCKVTFILVNDKIKSFTYRGNNCIE